MLAAYHAEVLRVDWAWDGLREVEGFGFVQVGDSLLQEFVD